MSFGNDFYNFFFEPELWKSNAEHVEPVFDESIKNEQSYSFQPAAFNNAEAEMERPHGAPKDYNPMLDWEDKQILAKNRFLTDREERMYGVGKFGG